jgi:hypothetical protein
MRRLAGMIAVMVAAAALAAGCGSSSGALSVKKPGTLSKPEWIAAADNICSAAKQRASALPKPTTTDELVTQLDRLIEIFAKEEKDLRSLVPEAAEQASVNTVIEAAGLQVTLARGLQTVARSGDTTAITSFTAANAAKVQQAQRVAQQYGLKVCGNPR